MNDILEMAETNDQEREDFAREKFSEVIDILFDNEKEMNVKLRDASRILDAYYEDYKDTFSMQMAKAEMLIRSKEYSEALPLYRNAAAHISEQKLNTVLNTRIAECLFGMGSYSEAVNKYDEIIANNATDLFEYHIPRALAYAVANNDLQSGEDWLRNEFASDRRYTSSHGDLAVASLYIAYLDHVSMPLRKTKENERDAMRSLNITTQTCNDWISLSRKAKTMCENATISPDDEQAEHLSNVISQSEAMENFVRSFFGMLNSGEYLEAIQLFADGKHDEALALLNVQIQENRADTDTYCLIGRIHLNRENTDEAERNFVRALELNSANVDAIKYLAGIYEEQKKTQTALDYYKRGAELNDANCLDNAISLTAEVYDRAAAISFGEEHIENVRKSRECITTLLKQYTESVIGLELIEPQNQAFVYETAKKVEELYAYHEYADYYVDSRLASAEAIEEYHTADRELAKSCVNVLKETISHIETGEKRTVVGRLVGIGFLWIAVGVLLIVLGTLLGIVPIAIGVLVIIAAFPKLGYIAEARDKGKTKYGAFCAIGNLFRK